MNSTFKAKLSELALLVISINNAIILQFGKQITFSFTRIVTNFYLFVTSQHAEFDETKIVEEIKIAETGFESAPQAVMQLYLSFSFKRIDKTEFTTDRLFKGKFLFFNAETKSEI